MDDIYVVETGGLPTRFARGWHCLGTEREFLDGNPHSVDAFGTRLVVFGDSDDTLHVLDAYCRHMGADLGRGTVKGDSVACPFHDWRWGGDGRCAGVPYAKRTPRIAKTRSWPTCQENGLLFVWHDPERNPPPPEQAIPRIDEVGSDDWTDWEVNKWLINGSHSREIVDNLADTAHFFYVHGGLPIEFRNVFEGHVASQFLTNRGRADVGLGPAFAESTQSSRAFYYGPAYAVTHVHSDFGGLPVDAIVVTFHFPVAQDSLMIHAAVAVRKPEGLDADIVDDYTRMVSVGVTDGFEQDVDRGRHRPVRRHRSRQLGVPRV
jgi:3-ketosteroid 9alpha-monooxygenase subunit A